MGSYFSLHDAAFWEQTIIEAPAPSIWSNVHFSPLSSHQRVLLERPGRVYYSSNSGLRQGGVCVQVAEGSEISLLVGFEEQAGRLYSAVLLRAPDSQMHRFGREVEELVLSAPGSQSKQDLQAEASLASPSSLSRNRSLSATIGRQSQSQSTLLVDKMSLGEARDVTAGTDVISLGIELIATDPTSEQGRAFVVTSVDKGSWAEKQHINPGDEIVEINGHKAGDMTDQDFKVAWNNKPITLKVFKKESARQDAEFPYLLIYAVKEGVLLFFTSDVAECEEIVREVALSFGHKKLQAQDLGSRTSPKGRKTAPDVTQGPGTSAAENLAAALKVKCVDHFVGKAPPATTRTLTELLVADLKRRFAVSCHPEEQPDCTNCAVFCLRTMMALQLSVRGYDIRSVCEDRSDLGRKAGETVCAAWEQLWRSVRA